MNMMIIMKKRPMSVNLNKIHMWDVVVRVAITMVVITSLYYAGILALTLTLMLGVRWPVL